MTEGIVSFDEWQKLDLRVGKIIEVGGIEEAGLCKLTVDFGKEIGKRTICAGIKQYYGKEELRDKKAVFFVNLQPRKLKDIESQGMVLAFISNENIGAEKIVLIVPEKEVDVGEKIF